MSDEAQTPEEIYEQIPEYLEQERFDEAERLLVAVLRGAEDYTDTHRGALLTLGELYEKQGRLEEALIVCREVPDWPDSTSELGKRGLELVGRLRG